MEFIIPDNIHNGPYWYSNYWKTCHL